MQWWWAESESSYTFRLLAASAVLYNLGISLIFFLYGLFLLALGWREQVIGILASAMVLGGMVGVVPMAWLARRIGFRLLLPGSLLAAALALSARTVLLGYPSQLVLSLLAGICLSGWSVCLSPVLANSVEPPTRPAAFSLLFALAVVAGGLGGILGGYLPIMLQRQVLPLVHPALLTPSATTEESMRWTLLLGCGLIALSAVPAMRLTRGRIAADLVVPMRRNSLLVRCVLASACWSLAVGLFNPFAGLFFVRQMAVSVNRLSLIFCVVQFLQGFALMVTGGRVQKTFGLVPALVLLQVSAGLMLLLLAKDNVPLWAAVIYGCFMVLQRLCDPLLQCALMNAIPASERSAASAVFYFAWSIAGAISAGLGGSALQHFGYTKVLLVAGFASMTAAALSASLLRGTDKRAPCGVPSPT